MTQAERAQRATSIASAALDKKALQLVALDVHEVTSVADTFILLTGTSDRHARSIADGVVEAMRAAGEKPMGIEGYDEGRWVLIDYGDVIVHVFQSEVREAYDLERLWSDAPPLELGVAALGEDPRPLRGSSDDTGSILVR
jgi:ribosome-associated protein